MAKKKETQLNVGGRWTVVIVVMLCLALISFITAFVIGLFVSGSELEASGNVAHIKVVGPILSADSGGFMSSGVTVSTDVVKFIEKADENPEVSAILLEVNSPGGTPVASYEIVDAVKNSNKTTVAWIREAGASGAYWVASACDHVVANPMSLTGSIGVIGSYIEWEGTLHKYNASYRRLVSGEYKDMGSPFKTMSEEEEDIMNANLAALRSIFVQDVAANRGLEVSAVDAIADGRWYLGQQAYELGLVDQLGGKKHAVMWIEDKEEIEASLAEYAKPKSFAELLTEMFSGNSFEMGRGIGKSLLEQDNGGVSLVT